MAYTLNGIDLGDVQSEKQTQSSDLDVITYPLSTSKEATVFDYSGVRRTITIDGVKVTTSSQALWNFVASLDALQTGDQTTIIYHSDEWATSTTGNYTNGNFNVKVMSFTPTYINDSVHSIEYTIVLIEGEAGF